MAASLFRLPGRALGRLRRAASTVKRAADCRRAAGSAGKPVWRMLGEIRRYRRYWMTPSAANDYFEFELYRPEKSMDDILAYVPHDANQRIQRLARYQQYDCMAYDKRIEYLVFGALKLPHPRVMLYIFDGLVTDENYRRLDLQTATNLLTGAPVRRFFLKPAFSGGARGSDVITIDGGQLRRMDGAPTDLAGIVKEAAELPCGYVLQCQMQDQHPLMSGLNPDTVNTLRVVTHRSGASSRIVGIELRVGRKGGCFDNAVSGGVFVHVDARTFQTAGDCYVKRPAVRRLGQFHPDTNVKLSGITIPHADEIRELVLETAATAFTGQPYLGWDVAVAAGGPCLIEVNTGFEIAALQIAAGRGLRDDFHYSPEMMRGEQKSKWAEVNAYWRRLEAGSKELPAAGRQGKVSP